MNQFDTQLAWRSAAERLLQDARRLAGRGAQGRVAVVLHLSRLVEPRPHHRRVARALMQEAASWHEGQLFLLPDGDMALLCRDSQSVVPRSAELPRVADPQALPGMLARLLAVDAPVGCQVVSVWHLPQQIDALLDYATRQLAVAPRSTALPPPNRVSDSQGRSMSAPFSSAGPPTHRVTSVAGNPALHEEGGVGRSGGVGWLDGLAETAGIGDLLQRQTAIALGAGGQGHSGLRPLYHEVSFSIAGLEARITPPANVSSDPYLFRHLASKLDLRMLEMLLQDVGSGSPLDVRQYERAALHLNLTVPGVLSAAFDRFAAAASSRAVRVGVEVSLIEAVADGPLFARMRDRVRERGFTLVLDGVSHLALLMSRPGLLGADLIKLDWSPRLPELPDSEQTAVDRALHDIDLARVVLHRAETEQALRWGVAHGIRRFQGRHVDAMLGASRMVGCEFASGCRLQHCMERAAAADLVGRAGCHNQSLLDAGAPDSTDAMFAMSRANWPAAISADVVAGHGARHALAGGEAA